MTDELTAQELQELEAELSELATDFEEFEMVSGEDGGPSTGELSVLDAELSGTEFEGLGLDSDDSVADIRAMAEDEADTLWFFGGLKRKAKKLIRKIVRLVKKYRKLASCVPKVTAAVVAYKSGKWITAIRRAYSAYRCIKAKL